MLEQLISLIPALANVDLTLLRATHAGLITIENAHLNQFNILITGSRPGSSSDPSFRPADPHSSKHPGGQGPVPISSPLSSGTWPLRIAADPDTPGQDSVYLQPLSIPFSTGLHIDLSHPARYSSDWWSTPPSFQDIARNMRFVPLLASLHLFPSLESPERIITVRIDPEAISISRPADQISFLIPLTENISSRTLHFMSNDRHWSLRYLRPNVISKLTLNDSVTTVQYRRASFDQLWWLVNHHPSRGDQGYLLMKKPYDKETS